VSTEGVRSLGPQLAEMDRLLHDIQVELMPDREPTPVLTSAASTVAIPDPPAPAPPPPVLGPPPPPPDPALDHRIRALTELSERLVASMRELLAGYERVLAANARARPEPAGVTLSAGPFASIEALREFEAAVSDLRGVREVVVRGYEGTDRAIIDVRLGGSNP